MPRHVVRRTTADALDAILTPRITLAIWQRPLPAGIADETGALDFAAIDDLRFDEALAQVPARLADALAAAGYPAAAGALAADVAALAHRFGTVMACDRVDLRLEAIDSDACWKFHADSVTARLISTYLGPGTQWLGQADAAAHAAGAPPRRVRALATGAVAMFKGRVWSPEAAIVHRSPPVAGTGVQRLVLVINPAAPGVVHA